ncbi:MAG: hypothetical protein Q4G19_07500 [Clostridia bacterium]|nr:hypothetical protein [Clostridia bacterium]
MKKIIAMMLALALLLPCVCGLAAETPADTAREMYDALETLLLYTDNVTLTGTATLYLDGERFKTLNAKYIAGGEDSFWDLRIFTPRAYDPEDKASGFTVIRNGELVYSMEVMKPGMYSMSSTYAPNTLLTETVQLRQLIDLGGLAVELFAATAGEGLTVKTDDAGNTTLHATMEDGFGVGLVDSALNLLVQSVFRRYRRLDFDNVYLDAGSVEIGQFGTVFEGIMYCLKCLSMSDTDVTVTADADGKLVSAGGKVNVNYYTRSGSQHLLTADFSVNIGDYGTSAVKEFDPADYNALPESYSAVYLDMSDEELYAMQERAKAICAETGFVLGENYTCGAWRTAGPEWIQTITEVTNNDTGITYYCVFDPEMKVVELQDIYGSYLNGVRDNCSALQDDPAKLNELLEKLNAFMDKVYPGLTKDLKAPQVSFEWMDGDIHYIHLDYLENEVTLVVMLEPEWRIMYFSTVSNG